MTVLLTPQRLIPDPGELFSLPAVAMEVLALADTPGVDPAMLRRSFERDPALTAKVLRVVNSSLYGLKNRVTNLNQAVTMLGLKPLKLLVLGFSLPNALSHGIEAQALEHYWKFSLTKAVVARELSERLRPGSADDAMLAGLLSDVGMLVLIQRLRNSYVRIFQRVLETQHDLREVERHALGFDHIQLTVQLLEVWGLAPRLIRPIAGSIADEQPAEASDDLAAVLRFADLAALFICQQRTDALPRLSSMATERFGLPPGEFAELIDSLAAKIGELAQSLSLDLPVDRACGELLRQATRQLNDAAGEAVAEPRPVPADTRTRASFNDWSELQELSQAAESVGTGRALGQPDKERPPEAAAAPNVQQPQKTPAPGQTRAARSIPESAWQELSKTLAATITVARLARLELTLIVLEADRSADQRAAGQWPSATWRSDLEHACRQIDHPTKVELELGPATHALILLGCDRKQAVQFGTDLLLRVRHWSQSGAGGWPTISLGSATVPHPSPNFDPQGLIDAARRCLSAAQVSGNGLKSIEIY